MSVAEQETGLFDGSAYEYREVDGYSVEKVVERFGGSLDRADAAYLEWLKDQQLGSHVELKVLMSLESRHHILRQDNDGNEHLSETVVWKIQSVTQA